MKAQTTKRGLRCAIHTRVSTDQGLEQDFNSLDAQREASEKSKLAVEERRKKDWKPRQSEFGSGAIWKYAQQVGPARHGAVTHPGAQGEARCYADI